MDTGLESLYCRNETTRSCLDSIVLPSTFRYSSNELIGILNPLLTLPCCQRTLDMIISKKTIVDSWEDDNENSNDSENSSDNDDYTGPPVSCRRYNFHVNLLARAESRSSQQGSLGLRK